jgi:hypothetical protein
MASSSIVFELGPFRVEYIFLMDEFQSISVTNASVN